MKFLRERKLMKLHERNRRTETTVRSKRMHRVCVEGAVDARGKSEAVGTVKSKLGVPKGPEKGGESTGSDQKRVKKTTDGREEGGQTTTNETTPSPLY